MKKILLLILLFILSSCFNNYITDPYSKNGISKLGASPDERFMGNYSRISYYFSNRRWYKYISYSFTNQNKYIYYSVETYYGYREEPLILTYEWKKEDEIYYSRLWDNQYDDWKVFNLEYVDTETIIINDKEYTK
ncbi:hypothetical protein [Brachyspira murdochii]|uniref:hypothetical protein n=1 Tax=Brachyspira murdochii TaxID=84378 RepID=UPI0012F47A90|nr:hypothetical protein [Brachyspira murdochii]